MNATQACEGWVGLCNACKCCGWLHVTCASHMSHDCESRVTILLDIACAMMDVCNVCYSHVTLLLNHVLFTRHTIAKYDMCYSQVTLLLNNMTCATTLRGGTKGLKDKRGRKGGGGGVSNSGDTETPPNPTPLTRSNCSSSSSQAPTATQTAVGCIR